MPSNIEKVDWEYNESVEAIKMIKKALRRMGFYVYSNPCFSNSTCEGIIISKNKMSRKEIYAKGKN